MANESHSVTFSLANLMSPEIERINTALASLGTSVTNAKKTVQGLDKVLTGSAKAIKALGKSVTGTEAKKFDQIARGMRGVASAAKTMSSLKGIDQITSRFNQLNASLGATSAATGKNRLGNALNSAVRGMDKLNKTDISPAIKRMRKLATAMGEAAAAAQRFALATRAANRAAGIGGKTSVGGVTVAGTAPGRKRGGGKGAQAGMGDASFGQFIVGAAAAGALRSQVSVGVDFEKAMSGVRAATQATDSDFQKLGDTARELGRTSIFGAGGAAEAMDALGKAGLKTSEILETTPATMRLAAAGEMELGEASETLVKILAGFQKKTSDSADVVDLMAKAAVESTTSVKDIAHAMSFVGGIAAEANLDIKDVTVSIALLQQAGVKGGRAGRNLRQVIASLLDISSASMPTKRALADIGLTVDQLNPRVHGLETVIRTFGSALARSPDSVDKLAGIFSTEVLTGITTLASRGGSAFDEMNKRVSNFRGESERLAATMTDNVAGAFARLKASLSEFSIALIDTWGPLISGVLNTVSGLANMVGGPFTEALASGTAALFAFAAGVVAVKVAMGFFSPQLLLVGAAIAGTVAVATLLVSGLNTLSKTSRVAGISWEQYRDNVKRTDDAMGRLNTRFNQMSLSQVEQHIQIFSNGLRGTNQRIAELSNGTSVLRNELDTVSEDVMMKLSGSSIKKGMLVTRRGVEAAKDAVLEFQNALYALKKAEADQDTDALAAALERVEQAAEGVKGEIYNVSLEKRLTEDVQNLKDMNVELLLRQKNQEGEAAALAKVQEQRDRLLGLIKESTQATEDEADAREDAHAALDKEEKEEALAAKIKRVQTEITEALALAQGEYAAKLNESLVVLGLLDPAAAGADVSLAQMSDQVQKLMQRHESLDRRIEKNRNTISRFRDTIDEELMTATGSYREELFKLSQELANITAEAPDADARLKKFGVTMDRAVKGVVRFKSAGDLLRRGFGLKDFFSQITTAAQKFSQAGVNVADILANAFSGSTSALADFFNDMMIKVDSTKKLWENFTDAVVASWRRAVAQMMAESIAKATVGPIMDQLGAGVSSILQSIPGIGSMFKPAAAPAVTPAVAPGGTMGAGGEGPGEMGPPLPPGTGGGSTAGGGVSAGQVLSVAAGAAGLMSIKGAKSGTDVASNIATGAASGAMIGSVVPIVGTAIGGILGGIYGALKSGSYSSLRIKPQGQALLTGINSAIDEYTRVSNSVVQLLTDAGVPAPAVSKLMDNVGLSIEGKTKKFASMNAVELLGGFKNMSPAQMPAQQIIDAVKGGTRGLVQGAGDLMRLMLVGAPTTPKTLTGVSDAAANNGIFRQIAALGGVSAADLAAPAVAGAFGANQIAADFGLGGKGISAPGGTSGGTAISPSSTGGSVVNMTNNFNVAAMLDIWEVGNEISSRAALAR